MKKNKISLKIFTSIFIFFFIRFSIFSQVRDDFYDPYDFNLKNYQGGEGVGKDYDYYRDYQLPLKKNKPTLVTPKNPQIPPDPLLMMPLPTNTRNPMQFQQFNSQSSPQAVQKRQSSIINPLTGEIDYRAMRKNQEEAKIRKERQKKQREAFEKREPYTETKARRFEIIFFMTWPFAIALTYIIASLRKFQKTATGTAFVGLGSIGLSLLNAFADKSRFEEYEKNKPPEQKQFQPDQDKDDLSQKDFGKKNWQLYFQVAEKKF
ncbi:MAG: hypothetical protein L6Q54_07980 [Leptospiraceae bacterium]|nr:hypothetical protein [Leptospiraceae bacterium]MCK6381173.1 hypothetical protein [Leptospiraceae bacterium]NUM40861.1 hypothetical protein [Leptospiraceae bacterium]